MDSVDDAVRDEIVGESNIWKALGFMEDSSSDVMKKAVLRTILDGGENEFLKFENLEEVESK